MPPVNMMPERCDRCGGDMRAWIMSKFNRDQICIPCKDDEKDAPGYAAADEAEVASVRSGNYNYAGVGLSGEDRDFLSERRLARKRDRSLRENAGPLPPESEG